MVAGSSSATAMRIIVVSSLHAVSFWRDDDIFQDRSEQTYH